jgi:predicted metal-dependent hydrolase
MTPDAPPEARQALLKALAEFNSWRFYDCHETLEDVWLESGGKADAGHLTGFYHGLIKAAAGFHHVLRHNYKGATILLTDALRLLTPYEPATLTVDVASLTNAIRASLNHLADLGPDRIAHFERATIPRISYDPDALADQ